jgi:nitroimidazol reductase NimA-like FMN-containing flavoprotein (pyridoxamine 5'-phosphate oxidase superfamily)
MPIPREQLRLTADELEELLAAERTARVATVGPDGSPHVIPMWFVWREGALWCNSLIRSRRTRDIEHGSRAAVCVDTGADYAELRGAVLYGVFEHADDDEALPGATEAFASKYWGGSEVPSIRSHVWLKLVPERLVSWDFRKIPAGRDRRLEAGGRR